MLEGPVQSSLETTLARADSATAMEVARHDGDGKERETDIGFLTRLLGQGRDTVNLQLNVFPFNFRPSAHDKSAPSPVATRLPLASSSELPLPHLSHPSRRASGQPCSPPREGRRRRKRSCRAMRRDCDPTAIRSCPQSCRRRTRSLRRV